MQFHNARGGHNMNELPRHIRSKFFAGTVLLCLLLLFEFGCWLLGFEPLFFTPR